GRGRAARRIGERRRGAALILHRRIAGGLASVRRRTATGTPRRIPGDGFGGGWIDHHRAAPPPGGGAGGPGRSWPRHRAGRGRGRPAPRSVTCSGFTAGEQYRMTSPAPSARTAERWPPLPTRRGGPSSGRAAEKPPPILSLVRHRTLIGVITLFAVSAVVFLATEVLPGNAAYAILGHSATPARVRALEIQLHLNRGLF